MPRAVHSITLALHQQGLASAAQGGWGSTQPYQLTGWVVQFRTYLDDAHELQGAAAAVTRAKIGCMMSANP
jgi:hypothetical protein